MVPPLRRHLLCAAAAALTLGLLVGCHPGPPRVPEDAFPHRAVAGYPIRMKILSREERDRLGKEATAKNPGWTVTIEDFGLLEYAIRDDKADLRTEQGRAMVLSFLQNNLALVGLRSIDTLPPPSAQWEIATKNAPQFRIHIGHHDISGWNLPGADQLPAPFDDDTLLTPFLGRAAERYVKACSDERELHQCDPVGPNDCRGPEPVHEGSTRTQREDFFIGQRYWYPMLICATREVEWRSLAEPRRNDQACVRGRSSYVVIDLPPQLDALTGSPLEVKQLIGASTRMADEACK